MHFTPSFVALAVAVSSVSAAPRFYGKRAASAADILVYTFADVLEQLESSFYTQALAKFQPADFTAAGYTSPELTVQQFTNIQRDESTHSSVLQDAIKSFGASPLTSCAFNFDSVLTDVATMAATARLVENVGVGAYLGGAVLISDPVLLDAAASILTVEARHQTVLNIFSGSGSAIPAAFDIALSPSEVLAIAGSFLSGCDVGIPANPSLSVTNTGGVGPGTSLTFASPALNGSTSGFFCQMMVGGEPFSRTFPIDNCVVPSDLNGPVALFITSDGQPLLNNVPDRATKQLIAGPTMAFIDSSPELLGGLTRNTASGQAPVSTSTSTISPAEASAVLAGASSTGAASAPSSTSTSAPSSSSAAVGSTFIGVKGGPNTFTGETPGGIVVNGWMGI